ncbi:LysR family transcriptional regulator [Shewanella eurypsychrophilus]|uniref:LysR family transcriptional regulator n=1 Tax=Shewanella eurypsychrophilus TaxID=2593656 RepID=A0ABX6V7H0_9GAMM|nr:MULTISPECIES: LysR family transcriptional regulator [Shewanella]QFU22511.1 LysR family transcriptional regulator [Shewanella sp. YLB-09]QPG57799.1 LysR family transcriptional regulator [Shewanella eurypsychrophilus]
MRLKTTLDQWLTLSEIDRAGSIQAASVRLNKSHTTLIYAVKKLEEQLGVSLVQIKGRRAVLSDDGKVLLRRADSMLEQARELEEISTQLARGIESEITIAVDHLCDRSWLYQPMADFLRENSCTSIQVIETSLSKTSQMVTDEQADISIVTLPVTNYPSEAFGIITMLPVVAKTHPLAGKNPLCSADFTTISQIVIRDLGGSGKQNAKQDVGWLKSRQRITVDNFDHAWQAVELGVGFCRLPEHLLNSRSMDNIVILKVENAESYQVPLHLTLPKGAKTGPAAKCLYQLLLESKKFRSIDTDIQCKQS